MWGLKNAVGKWFGCGEQKKWENEKGRDVTTEGCKNQKSNTRVNSGQRIVVKHKLTTNVANATMCSTYVVHVCIPGVHEEDQQQNTIQNKIAHPRPTVLCRGVEIEEQLNEITKDGRVKMFYSAEDS